MGGNSLYGGVAGVIEDSLDIKREEDFEGAQKHNRFYVMKRIGEHKSGVLTLANMKQNGLKGAPMGTLNLSDASFKQLLAHIERNF